MNLGKQNTNTETLTKVKAHSFYIKRTANSQAYPSVSVDFSPSSLITQPCTANGTPSFNHDNLYFTPCFVLAADKPKMENNLSIYLGLHQKKQEEMEQQKIEIFVPKPSRPNSFCCVCKTSFQDYLTHVNMPEHRKLMVKSLYCAQIQSLCQKFNPLPIYDIAGTKKSKKIRKCPKKCKVDKVETLTSTSIETENSFQNKIPNQIA